MSRRIRPVLSVLCLSLALSLPLQAQVVAGPGDGPWSFLSALWERLGAPLVSVWSGDVTEGRGIMDPDGETSEGRGAWDPNGVTNKNDGTGGVGSSGNVEPDPGTTEGRGAWDPNG
jgi:hypothetical protein